MTITTPRPNRPRNRTSSARPQPPAAAVVRAGAALVALLAITLVVPAVLMVLGAALPVDLTALSPAGLARPDDGGLILLVLLAVAWVTWAVVVVTVAVEVWAALRQVPSPRLPGLATPQRLVASAVALVVVGLVPGSPATAAGEASSSTGAGQQSLSVLVAATTDQVEVGRAGAERLGVAPRDAAAAPAAPHDRPHITTRRHDTLWSLAERHLGFGERFTEIAALNQGVVQTDGRTLGTGGRLYPGWTLQLPADADVAGHANRHVVERGDTLWGIAEEELGDGTRYPEIFRVNRGDRQADGRRLTDPDLIIPGWDLEIPRDADAPAKAEGPAKAKGGEASEGPAKAEGSAKAEGEEASEGSGGTEGPDLADPGPAAGGVVPAPLDRAPDPAHQAAPRPPSSDIAPAPAPSPSPTSAPPTSAPPTSAPQASAPAPEVPDPMPTIDRATLLPESAIPLPAGGALGVLLLAGLATELTRRRRQYQRHRRPGERMPMPGDDARDVEAAAREAAGDPGPELLEQALGQLARGCRDEGVGLPPIRLVRLTPASVHLHLAAPLSTARAPFRAVDAVHWELDPSLLLPADDAEGLGLPGLLTIGMREDETVLVNLAQVGTLRVIGAASALPGVLRALASELALGPAGEGTVRTLALSDDAVSEAIRTAMEAGDLAVETDPDRLARTLAAAMARGPQDPWEGDPLELVLTDRPLSIAVPGQSGAALITTEPGAVCGATLVLSADGSATLDPDGIALVPQTLAAAASAGLCALLRATEVPLEAGTPLVPAAPSAVEALRPATATASRSAALAAVPPPVVWPAAGDDSAMADASRARSGPADFRREDESDRAAVPRQDVPYLRLLGEVRVDNAHGKAESTRIGRLAQTAAFVLLNPDSRPSELQAALWPGRRSNPQTCRQMISRTRTWLGRTEAGEPFLMQLAQTDGRLRMRDEVTSDWAEFQRLAALGLADPGDTARLSEALGLVRGRPFGTVAARELPWADLFVNEMISQITDVAHELAMRYERLGQWSAARDAALRGLRTECESEILEAVVARLGRSA